jgi:hypothetical protein
MPTTFIVPSVRAQKTVMRAGDEVLWDIDEHATLSIEPPDPPRDP